MFSRRALPRTMALLAGYPEHDRLWELFIAEHKHWPEECRHEHE
jgi:hypothetical protein